MSRLTISAPPLRGALDDFVDARLRRPAHLDQIGQRNAGDRRVADQRHHGVAMAAEHEGGDVFDRDVEFVGEEIAEARRVEHAGHADHLLLRQAGEFLQRPHHGVERVGDADDEGVRRVFLDAGADLPHHLEIDAEQIVAAHAGLARHAGGDDADVGALDGVVAVGAGELGVETIDRRGFGDVERLALRDAFHDVEHHDVAEFLEADEVGERAADLAGADQRNLVTRHGGKTLELLKPQDAAKRGLSSLLYCSNTVLYAKPAVYTLYQQTSRPSPAQSRRHQVSTILSDQSRPCALARTVRQAEIGLRTHLDQARGGALEFVRLVAFGSESKVRSGCACAEASSFTAWS